MAKIQVYKFVNYGAIRSTAPTVVAAKQSLLATNRLGRTIHSVGKEVVDINKLTSLRLKTMEKADIAERRLKRRQMDQEAEELQESIAGKKNLSEYFKKKSKLRYKKSDFGAGISKMLKGAFGWVQPLLGPFVSLFTKLGATLFMKELLEWASDESNIEAMTVFLEKTAFVFKKIYGFGEWIIKDNLLAGFDQLFGSDSSFLGRVEGLGKMMTGIIGLKYLMNPFSIITDIIFLANIISGAGILTRAKGCLPKNFNRRINPKNKGPLSRSRRIPTTTGGRSTGPLGSVREFFKKFRGKTQITGSGSKPSLVKRLTDTFKRSTKITQSGATKGNVLTNLFKKSNVTQSGVKPNSFIKPKVTQSFVQNQGLLKNLKNIKVNPGTIASGATNFVKGFGIGMVLDYSVNKIADEVINKPLKRMADKKLQEGVEKRFLETGSEATIQYYTEELNKENSKKGLNWWQNALTLGYGNIFVGPSKPKVEKLTQALDYAKEITKPKDELPKINYDANKNKKKKGLFGWGFLGLNKGGELPEFIFGGIFRGIKRAVSGVVNTVGKVVSGVVNTVTKVVSNPIVSTALSFVPGIGPIVGAINAVSNLAQGNILGAITSGIGAVGQFANINTVNAINQPRWMQNLRFSKFGRGLSNLYFKGANAFSAASSFLSNTVGAITDSRIGKIGMKLLGGNTGGAIGEVVGMIPGLQGRMEGFGNWLEKNQLQGILGAVPGVSGLLKNIPNVMSIPGMEKILGGEGYGFSASRALGSVADRFGMGGIYAAIMSGAQSGDYVQGLRELAPELGVDPRILGVLDKGRALLSNNKFNAEYAMQTAIEFLPVPLIVEKLIPAPTPVPINSGDTYLVAPSTTNSKK